MEKIENLRDYVISVVVGIRFRANFSIEDKLGNIADQILYAKNSMLDPTFFPYVQSSANEKILLNDKTNDSLKINNSNIILEINFADGFDEERMNKIYESFNSQIILGVLKEHRITQINRIGHINRYLFAIPSLAKSFLDKTIGKTIEGINDINLSFSKKHPIEESLVKEEINDYNNAIYNVIKRSNMDELFISLDYQRYYVPFLESSSQIEFFEFLNKMTLYNKNIFLKWLTENYMETDYANSKS